MKTLTKLSLLLLSVLLAACSKEGNEEEGPIGPYELRVYPSEAGFHTSEFGYVDADISIFSDTLFIRGGTPPYRIEPVEEMFQVGRSKCDKEQIIYMKTLDVFNVTVKSTSSREADQLIIKCVYYENRPPCGPVFFFFFPVEFMIYDKNGGYAKFEVCDRDLIGGL